MLHQKEGDTQHGNVVAISYQSGCRDIRLLEDAKYSYLFEDGLGAVRPVMQGRASEDVLLGASAECDENILGPPTDLSGEFDRTITEAAGVHPSLELIEINPRDICVVSCHAAPLATPAARGDGDGVIDRVAGLRTFIGGIVRVLLEN
jgi:hypothetical protein